MNAKSRPHLNWAIRNPLTWELLDLFNNANFEVLQCYKQVFTVEHFAKNIVGWIILLFMISQTVFLVLYSIEVLIPMEIFSFNISKSILFKSINGKLANGLEEEDEI